jgi:hypothetical protein
VVKQRLTKLFHTSPYRNVIIFTIPVLLLLTLLTFGCLLEGSQQFSLLAQAFLHGQTNFLHPIGGLGQDPVLYHGKVYWDEGPFPGLFLVPFVALFNVFHLFFYQGYIKWTLLVGILFFVYRIARILKYSKEDSAILSLGFTLGSVFIGVAGVSSSWFFAQVMTTFLLLWSLYEFYTRKRWWLLGVICGFILMTRPTAGPILIFFVLELWQVVRHKNYKLKLKPAIALLIPVGVAIVLVGVYNFIRFHSPLNDGNDYQLLFRDSANARAYGIFSLIHIPTKFYSAFLSAPLPVSKSPGSWILKFPYLQDNEYGMSMFITSPYLLYLFSKKWSAYNAQARRLLVAGGVSCLLVLSYFGIGLDQFGYRYSLDFFPEIFLVFMILYHSQRKGLTRGMKFLLLGSGIVNFYLMCTFLT